MSSYSSKSNFSQGNFVARVAQRAQGLARHRRARLAALVLAVPAGVDLDELRTALDERLEAAGLGEVELIFEHTEQEPSLLAAEYEPWAP